VPILASAHLGKGTESLSEGGALKGQILLSTVMGEIMSEPKV